MHALHQMNPELYYAAVRKQEAFWNRLVQALPGGWERSLSPRWRVEIELSPEEVLEDLVYGRD